MSVIVILFTSIFAMLFAVLLWAVGVSFAKAFLIYVLTGTCLFTIATIVVFIRNGHEGGRGH